MTLFGNLYRKSEQKRFYLPTHLVALAVLAVLAASLWLLGLILISHSALESSHSKAMSKKNSNAVVSPHAVAAQDDDNILEDLWPDDLSNENVLESLHSCFDECHPDHNTPATTQIIGLLFLPGSLGLLFVDFVQEVVRAHSPNNNDHPNAAVQWIPTSHLPSSNADENNYSHIIRFANLPIMLAVGDALLFMTSSDLDTITPLDVQETAQLFISWHCQLSNMADTQSVPVMTMTMEQIEADQIETELYLREFVGTALDDFEEEGDDDATMHIDEDELVTSLEQIVGKIQKTLQRIDQQLIVNDNKMHNTNLQTLVNNAIQDTLQGEKHCPPNNNINNYLFVPTSPLALRVYQFIKPRDDEADDQTLCQEAPLLAHSLACKTLMLPFPQPKI
jgi:hypothetical protein